MERLATAAHRSAFFCSLLFFYDIDGYCAFLAVRLDLNSFLNDKKTDSHVVFYNLRDRYIKNWIFYLDHSISSALIHKFARNISNSSSNLYLQVYRVLE
jgi:hypothetical protein